MKKELLSILCVLLIQINYAQNSMVGDGFGGRLWYTPTNYSVGSYSGYSICNDSTSNQLYGWGDNGFNQLGLGLSVTGVNLPAAIPNITDIKYYSAGYLVGAVKNDGTGWAWGTNSAGTGFTGNPIQVISDVFFLDASSSTISYIKNDGSVWSIGNNDSGNFGDGTGVFLSPFVTIPVKMLNINNAVRVANSGSTTIILLSDSTLMAAGSDNGKGLLGLGTSISQAFTPMTISGLPKIIDIKSNSEGTIALTDSGSVYFWGRSPNLIINSSPIKLSNLNNIVAISACDDGSHFLALDENKYCFAWGQNSFNQYGQNPTTSIPKLIDSNVIDIMAGELFSYLIKSDSTLWGVGVSKSGGSIWLNLLDIQRSFFTQIDPSLVSGSCPIVLSTSTINPNNPITKNLLIYPNPTSDQLTITSSNITNVKIIDISGQVLKTITTNLNNIDVSDLITGIYFIQLITKEGIIIKKFIKQ
jgi:alpha-tubulin suppressor-like RCC1 family protein